MSSPPGMVLRPMVSHRTPKSRVRWTIRSSQTATWRRAPRREPEPQGFAAKLQSDAVDAAGDPDVLVRRTHGKPGRFPDTVSEKIARIADQVREALPCQRRSGHRHVTQPALHRSVRGERQQIVAGHVVVEIILLVAMDDDVPAEKIMEDLFANFEIVFDPRPVFGAVLWGDCQNHAPSRQAHFVERLMQ